MTLVHPKTVDYSSTHRLLIIVRGCKEDWFVWASSWDHWSNSSASVLSLSVTRFHFAKNDYNQCRIIFIWNIVSSHIGEVLEFHLRVFKTGNFETKYGPDMRHTQQRMGGMKSKTPLSGSWMVTCQQQEQGLWSLVSSDE